MAEGRWEMGGEDDGDMAVGGRRVGVSYLLAVTPKFQGISSYIRKSTRARRGCCTRYFVLQDARVRRFEFSVVDHSEEGKREIATTD